MDCIFNFHSISILSFACCLWVLSFLPVLICFSVHQESCYHQDRSLPGRRVDKQTVGSKWDRCSSLRWLLTSQTQGKCGPPLSWLSLDSVSSTSFLSCWICKYTYYGDHRDFLVFKNMVTVGWGPGASRRKRACSENNGERNGGTQMESVKESLGKIIFVCL